MKPHNSLDLLAILLFVTAQGTAIGALRSAGFVEHNLSLAFGPASQSAGFRIYFSTYDGVSTWSLYQPNYGYNGEVRPDSGADTTYRADYDVYDPILAYFPGYGWFTAVMPGTDVNGDGLADFLDISRNGNTGFSGNGYDYAPGVGEAAYAFTGSLTRTPGANQGTYNILTSDGTSASGTFYLGGYSGNITYDTTTRTMSIDGIGFSGASPLTGTIAYDVLDSNTLRVNTFTYTQNNEGVSIVGAFYMTRSGSTYCGRGSVSDGNLNTGWADFTMFHLTFTDSNDTDLDGIPDLTDPPIDPPSAPTVSAPTAITQTGFTATWLPLATATGYRLDVSLSSSFSTFVTGYSDLDLGPSTFCSVSGLNPNTPYYYRVRAYNSGGVSQNSIAVTATTLPNPPTIVSDPRSRNVPVGGSVTFSVVASGSGSFSYQWRHDTAAVPGATGATYTIPSVSASHSGSYDVTVSNDGGLVTRSPATLTFSTPSLSALNIGISRFENPVIDDGQENGLSDYTVPGWVEGDEMYLWAWSVYNPDPATLPMEAHSGENVLKSLAYRSRTQYVEQQLVDTLQPYTAYELSAWVCDPEAHDPPNSVELILFAGTTRVGLTRIQPDGADLWKQGVLAFETSESHPNLNQPLKIRFKWGEYANYRVFIDDIELTATPITPPPSPPSFDSIAIQSDGSALLRIGAPTQAVVTVYTSTNLLHWTAIAVRTNDFGMLEIHDTAAVGVNQRYYRASADW